MRGWSRIIRGLLAVPGAAGKQVHKVCEVRTSDMHSSRDVREGLVCMTRADIADALISCYPTMSGGQALADNSAARYRDGSARVYVCVCVFVLLTMACTVLIYW